MSLPITYILLEEGSTSWKIPVSFSSSVSEKRDNIFCVSSQGLFVDGENDAEVMERTYSNGSVLPPSPRFSGKDITLDFIIFSRSRSSVNVKTIFESFKTFLRNNKISLKTDYPQDYTAQVQRIDVLNENWGGGGLINFRVFLKCQEGI